MNITAYKHCYYNYDVYYYICVFYLLLLTLLRSFALFPHALLLLYYCLKLIDVNPLGLC